MLFTKIKYYEYEVWILNIKFIIMRYSVAFLCYAFNKDTVIRKKLFDNMSKVVLVLNIAE